MKFIIHLLAQISCLVHVSVKCKTFECLAHADPLLKYHCHPSVGLSARDPSENLSHHHVFNCLFLQKRHLLPLWLIKIQHRLTFHRNAKPSPALCEDNWNRLCLPRHSRNVLLMTLTKSTENQNNTEPTIQSPYYWLELWLQGHETAVRAQSINWFRNKDEAS